MGDMKMRHPTAKIRRAVAFELSCPNCKGEVEGPEGSCSLVYEDEFSEHNLAYCLECGSPLSMPKIPKRVNTTESL